MTSKCIYLLNSTLENITHSLDDMIYKRNKFAKKVGSGVFLWAFSSRHKKFFEKKLAEGDNVILYVKKPVSGVILLGEVGKRFVDNTQYWPINSNEKDNWPCRFYIRILKGIIELLSKSDDRVKSMMINGISYYKLQEMEIYNYGGQLIRICDEDIIKGLHKYIDSLIQNDKWIEYMK